MIFIVKLRQVLFKHFSSLFSDQSWEDDDGDQALNAADLWEALNGHIMILIIINNNNNSK